MPLTEITTSADCEKLKELLKNDTVIIFYHMDGCSHCQQLMPTFNHVLEKEDDDQGLIQNANIFKIESSYLHLIPNDLEQILQKVYGFPYIVSYANNKKIEEFTQARDVPHIKNFIVKNTSSKTRPIRQSGTTTRSSGTSTRPKKALKKYTTI